MTVQELKESIEKYHTEMEFSYHGQRYFISDNFSEGIFLGTPESETFVQSVEEALDTMMIDGKILRERLNDVSWG